jgi:hypothetical protein
MNRHPGESRGPGSFKNLDSGFRRNDERRISDTLLRGVVLSDEKTINSHFIG